MALTFPNSPTSGQFYTAENGIEYRYDGTKWTTVGSDNATAGIYAGDNVSLLTNDAGYITAAQVPAPTPTDTLNAIKTVDGSGSGLDADLLDGQEGTYYLNYNNFSNTPSLATVATSGSYNDLSNQPSIPTPGSGIITINQGGSQKGQFNVNQAGNTTVDLEGGSTNPLSSVVSVGFRDPWTGNDNATISGLTLNISPYTTSERHLIIVSLSVTGVGDGYGADVRANGSTIAVTNDAGTKYTFGGSPAWNNPHGVGTTCWHWLYHPNTTGNVQYTVVGRNASNNTMRVNHSPGVTDSNQPGGTSSITVLRFK